MKNLSAAKVIALADAIIAKLPSRANTAAAARLR